jgi:hypothetical protein
MMLDWPLEQVREQPSGVAMTYHGRQLFGDDTCLLETE